MQWNFDPNPLFYHMVKLYSEAKPKDDKITIFNEGGSRSSKTFDFFHFLVFYFSQHPNKGLECYCHRDTLTNCRDYTLKDFVNCLKIIGCFDPSKLTGVNHKPYYDLFGNHVFFRGLDDESSMEGYPSDIAFFNELLEVNSESKIAGIKMRCRKLIVADWNPKYTTHWAFNYEGRPNTYFTKTTFRNNKHCPPSVVKEIMGYEPTPENIKNGTANEFRWKVYGLGERAAQEGLVFPDVTWIDEFPNDCEKVVYGMDFGYTNDPTAIVRMGTKGRDLFLKAELYTPIDNAILLADVCKKIIPEGSHVWCDSADPGMISDLRKMGIRALAAKKFPGCITWRIDIMKRYKIHIVNDRDFKSEAQSYQYRKVQGITLNEPEDKNNHLWDASGYVCQHELRDN